MSSTNSEFNKEHAELLAKKHQDTIQQIQKLQEMEKYMFQNLEKVNTQENNDIQQQEDAVERINQLSDMRIGLFNQLKDMYKSVQDDLHNDRRALADQIAMVGVVESELNRTKKNVDSIRTEKNNKLKLVEITDYESDRYSAHVQLLKIIVICAIIILITSIIFKRNLIPSIVATVIIVLTASYALYKMVFGIFDILSRDNFDYDKYNFYYDPERESSGYETVLEHDKTFLKKLGGEFRSGIKEVQDQINHTSQSLTKLSDATLSSVTNEATNLTKEGFSNPSDIVYLSNNNNVIQPYDNTMQFATL